MFQKQPNTVGQSIAAVRKAAGLSQETLAEQLHVTRQTISNWEGGKSLPDIEMLKVLAQVLDVPIERLIYGPQKDPVKPQTLEDMFWPPSRVCAFLAGAIYVLGLVSGIIEAGGAVGIGDNGVAYGFSLLDAFPIWWEAIIRGTILLALSRILKKLT